MARGAVPDLSVWHTAQIGRTEEDFTHMAVHAVLRLNIRMNRWLCSESVACPACPVDRIAQIGIRVCVFVEAGVRPQSRLDRIDAFDIHAGCDVVAPDTVSEYYVPTIGERRHMERLWRPSSKIFANIDP